MVPVVVCDMVPLVVWAFTVSATWGPMGDAPGLLTDDIVVEACILEPGNLLGHCGASCSTFACRVLFRFQ